MKDIDNKTAGKRGRGGKVAMIAAGLGVAAVGAAVGYYMFSPGEPVECVYGPPAMLGLPDDTLPGDTLQVDNPSLDPLPEAKENSGEQER